MIALNDRAIAAIRHSLNPTSGLHDSGDRHGELLPRCKSENGEVLRLKQSGNDHFRKKNFLAAIHKYSQVGSVTSAVVYYHCLLHRQSWRHLGLSLRDERL